MLHICWRLLEEITATKLLSMVIVYTDLVMIIMDLLSLACMQGKLFKPQFELCVNFCCRVFGRLAQRSVDYNIYQLIQFTVKCMHLSVGTCTYLLNERNLT